MKGKIIVIGSFDSDGRPINWRFDCLCIVPALAMTEDGFLWAGYSVAELKEIENK